LTVDASKLHFGKRNPGTTTDDILNDRSSAPNKAAILSALSAFDADDDERDDTYDAVDAGFVVNDGHLEDAEERKRKDANEEILYRTYKSHPQHFNKDAATRRSRDRTKLKEDTGMTDEAIEGWALMLSRTPNQMKQLETKYGTFSGVQSDLVSTSWRAPKDDSDGSSAEPTVRESHERGRGGGRERGRGRGRGGNVAGSSNDKDTENARKRKEANKASRANHNRRDQRARKMGRGGLP
jgi:activating signal cointegrator complex subunit 2